MNTDLSLAELDPAGLEAVEALEATVGGPVVAYRPGSPFAQLTEDQLTALQSTERRLGVQLLAYGI